MPTTDDIRDRLIANAGIELASIADVSACCETLAGHARAMTGADQVAVRARAGSMSCSVGDLPEQAGDDWHAFHVAAPVGDDETATPRRWSVQLHVHAPSVGDWRMTCDLLARQGGVGLERVLERCELAQAERRQVALVEAGKALSSERTLDGVLRRIVEQAMALTDARYGALGVLEDDGAELARFVTVGVDEETHARIGELPRGRGILGVLIEDPRPLRLDRLQDHPRSAGFPAHHPPMTTFLGVPIVTSGAVAGRIYLTEKAGGVPFTAEDERLAQVLASQAAIAIDNASLNERLQQVAAALEEASRHKSAFMANMSHELRSPLNTIIGYTRLLQEDARNLDEEQLEDLEIVRGSGEHLLALITDLLDLQKVEAGRVSLVLGDEHLGELLDAVVASVRPTVPEDVELVLEADELGDDTITCDRTRIRQVLLNVLGNALKFTSSGEVRIVARDAGAYVKLSVHDTGPGIPEADQPRIFETFYQSTQALGRRPGPREGAGLGLAITKLLVELHGGTVALQSTEGVGTTVTIRLPRGGPTQGHDQQ
jgi:signal transduction histidine kinase